MGFRRRELLALLCRVRYECCLSALLMWTRQGPTVSSRR